MVTADATGKIYYQPIPTGSNGSQNTLLDTINGSISGRVIWDEVGITNKEVMAGFESLTTDFTTLNFPTPFNHYFIYGDQSVICQEYITNGYLKVEHTNNLTGIIYTKGY